jgi:hypothetical protein
VVCAATGGASQSSGSSRHSGGSERWLTKLEALSTAHVIALTALDVLTDAELRTATRDDLYAALRAIPVSRRSRRINCIR